MLKDHSDSKRKEGNVLFKDALNTFYLQLYGIGHMVKDYSDSERKPVATIRQRTKKYTDLPSTVNSKINFISIRLKQTRLTKNTI